MSSDDSAAPASLSPGDLEQRYVHDVYNTIAPHFAVTRFNQWPRVRSFLRALPAHSLVGDVGCGNGKYLTANPSCYFLASDLSTSLIDIVQQRQHTQKTTPPDLAQEELNTPSQEQHHFDALIADTLHLPYRTGSLDAAISIAVLHHLSTPARRVQAIAELARVLRVGGRALVYVWSFEKGGQKKGRRIVVRDEQDTLVEWNMPLRIAPPKSAPQRTMEEATFIAPKREVQYQRYYHMFSAGELEELVKQVPCVKIVEHGFDHQNWFVVFERTLHEVRPHEHVDVDDTTHLLQLATDGYDSNTTAAVYKRGRPGYADAVIERVWDEVQRVGKAAPTVVEVGAGTGKFARAFMARKRHKVDYQAVEPVEAMLEQLREDANYACVRASAVRLPFDDESVSVIVCAQAFHWFATPRVAAQFARLLRKDTGRLVLVWNCRDVSPSRTPWMQALEDVVDPLYKPETPRHTTMEWQRCLADHFQLADTFVHEYDQPMPDGVDSIVERVLSASFVASRSPSEQDAIADRIRALLSSPEYADASFSSLPYQTRVFVYQLR